MQKSFFRYSRARFDPSEENADFRAAHLILIESNTPLEIAIDPLRW